MLKSLRNSIGINEGSVISPETECDCVWLMLLSLPPKYQLQKKCIKCIEAEADHKANQPEIKHFVYGERR